MSRRHLPGVHRCSYVNISTYVMAASMCSALNMDEMHFNDCVEVEKHVLIKLQHQAALADP